VSGWLGAIELAALAAVPAALVGALGVAGALRLFAGRLRRASPERRAQILGAMAVAPAALPLALLGLCLAPSIAGALGMRADHCLRHAQHPHLCLVHRPAPLPLPWAAAAPATGLVGAAALAVAARARADARRLRRALAARAGGRLAADVRLVTSPAPVAVTLGAWRPQIFVSEGLARALRPDGLRAVVEHERAHARRRDGLRKLAAGALSVAQLPGTRRRLLGELALACEQACDAEAARRTGDRLGVAETILAAERLLAGRGSPAAACAFGESRVRERVERLLAGDEPAPGRAGPAAIALAGALLVAGLAAADRIHHAAEHLIGMALG